jgi:DNA polymerase I
MGIKMNKKLVLIDGHSILNRTFYGVPNLTNSEGIHTNAVYGFLNIMFKILEEEKATYLTVAFDRKEPTFRHKMYKEYKGTRKSMPDELREQVPLIKKVLQTMDITIVEKAGYEADDILGTIARFGEKEGYEVALVSGDRDLLQLATDHIKIRMPKTKFGVTKVEDYYTKDVIEKYGVTPLQIIDLKGLMGDASDNIPGVPGIGEKTATKIIGAFSSIENAYAHIEEITPNRAKESLQKNYNLAELSKELATIKTDCEIDYKIEDTLIENMFNDQAFKLFKNLEFKTLLEKFQGDIDYNQNLEDSFTIIEKKQEANKVFDEFFALRPTHVGIQIIQDIMEKKDQHYNNEQYSLFIEVGKEKGVLGCSFTFSVLDKDYIYYFKLGKDISIEYLLKKFEKIMDNKISVSVLDLKSQLNYLSFTEKQDIFDLSIAAYLLNPLKDTYNYDDLARDYLSLSAPSYKELFGKMNITDVATEREEAYISYCCYVGYVACKAYPVLKELLIENQMMELFKKVEMPLIYTLYDMESRGIKVNESELKLYGDRLESCIIELKKNIHDIAGENFNINSPKQLGVILFEKMKMPFAKKTKTGYSTSADILEKLRSEDPIISMILEYRQLSKLKSTYADGLANYINKSDMRIHGKFNQTIAATGRISSTEPNLQNIPIKMEIGREIRKVFIPEEEYVFLDADYSQIELRVLAHMSGDKRLIDAYKEEQDIHKITASQVFHTPLEEVTSLQRSNAKAVNFGIVYGISSFGLGQDLNITRKEAEGYINKYFETYPRVKEFLDELVKKAKEKGYVTTLFERKRPVLEINSSNFMQRSFGERIAMNSPIQGTAADIIKIAMIHVNSILKERAFKSRLILQIHDELLIEAHKDEVDEVKEILIQEMHNAAKLDVPLAVDVNQGNNWYQAK